MYNNFKHNKQPVTWTFICPLCRKKCVCLSVV